MTNLACQVVLTVSQVLCICLSSTSTISSYNTKHTWITAPRRLSYRNRDRGAYRWCTVLRGAHLPSHTLGCCRWRRELSLQPWLWKRRCRRLLWWSEGNCPFAPCPGVSSRRPSIHFVYFQQQIVPKHPLLVSQERKTMAKIVGLESELRNRKIKETIPKQCMTLWLKGD